MVIYIFVGLALVIAVFAIVAALQPTDFRISRTVRIAAPAPVVFAEVNDFHKWTAWSPYEKFDPAMKRSYEGAPAGDGAVYSWNGNRNAGEGRSTIIESRPNELVKIRLEFVRPFKCTNTAEFTFAPEGDTTAVTWSLYGKNTFMGKAFGLIMNMDKMVGGQFEDGLGQLKSVAEASSKS